MPAAARLQKTTQAPELQMTHVLGPAEGDAGDALNVLQAELRDGLAGLLLVARVDSDLGTSGDAGVAGALVARLGAGLIVGNLGDLLLGLVGELFDTGVGHGGRFVGGAMLGLSSPGVELLAGLKTACARELLQARLCDAIHHRTNPATSDSRNASPKQSPLRAQCTFGRCICLSKFAIVHAPHPALARTRVPSPRLNYYHPWNFHFDRENLV